MRAPALLTLLALLASACHRPAAPPVLLVSRLQISDATLGELDAREPGLGLTPDQLQQHLIEALDSTGRFRPLPELSGGAAAPKFGSKAPPTKSYRVRVEVGFAREQDEETRGGGLSGFAPPGADAGTAQHRALLRRATLGLSMTLTAAGVDADALRAETQASRIFDPAPLDGASPASPAPAAPMPSSDLKPSGEPGPARPIGLGAPRARAFQAALDQALRQAAVELVAQVDAQSEPEPVLVAQLADPDGGSRESALRELVERKSPAAVPALLDRLKDPDRDLVLRTLGALEAIGDTRAVRPLIDLTERQDPAFVAQVIYVIGAIGGSDAEAFLFTLKNGTPDPQLRVAATEASADLRRRQRAPSAGPRPVKPGASLAH